MDNNNENTNPVPETPAPEPTPTPEPAPVAPAPVDTSRHLYPEDQPSVQKAEKAEKAKKRKKPIIIASVVAGLALIGGGSAFAATYIMHNQPTNIMLSSVNRFLTAKHIDAQGTITMRDVNDDGIIKQAVISLKEGSEGINVDSQVSINIQFNQDQLDIDPIGINLGATFIKEGVAYIQINNLKDTLESVKAKLIDTIKSSMVGYDQAALDTLIAHTEEFIMGLASDIDGEWWKIDLSEILDEVKEMETDQKNAYKTYYSCVLNAVNDEINGRVKYQDVYDKHSFVTLEESNGKTKYGKSLDEIFSGNGGKFYNVKVDAGKLDEFIGAVGDASDIADKIGKCTEDYQKALGYDLNMYDDDDDYDYVYEEEDDLDDYDDDIEVNSKYKYLADDIEFPEIVVGFNGFFSKELKSLYVHDVTKNYKDEDDFEYEVALNFSYSDNLTVHAPSHSKSISELVTRITDGVNQYMTDMQAFYSSAYSYPTHKCDQNDIDSMTDDEVLKNCGYGVSLDA